MERGGRDVIAAEEIVLDEEPRAVFRTLLERPYPFFLDGALDAYGMGRFSFLGADPALVLRSKGRRVELERQGSTESFEGDVFDVLDRLVRERRAGVEAADLPVPFPSGAVGYLAYEAGHLVESFGRTVIDDLSLPECVFAFYDEVLAYDRSFGRWFHCSRAGGNELLARLSAPRGAAAEASALEPCEVRLGELCSNFSEEGYREAVARAIEYIYAGDIYQVNLSQRFEVPYSGDAFDLYARLRRTNAAPYCACLRYPHFEVLSSSPERFLKVDGRNVETRPIKGTRPRGTDPESDGRLREELASSEKDHAELAMIVDLERNDLGRVCEPGTVKVARHAEIEEYARVFHLVSTVRGVLSEGAAGAAGGVSALLRATFPGGSVTGAPKIRAMEIIDELEPTERSVYTGALGYVSDVGTADLEIVIRTMIAAHGKLYLQVGGGVVADSDPELERLETLHKAQALFEALEEARV